MMSPQKANISSTSATILRSLKVIFRRRTRSGILLSNLRRRLQWQYLRFASESSSSPEIDSLKSGPDYISDVECFTLPKDEDKLIEALDDQSRQRLRINATKFLIRMELMHPNRTFCFLFISKGSKASVGSTSATSPGYQMTQHCWSTPPDAADDYIRRSCEELMTEPKSQDATCQITRLLRPC